MRLIQVYEPPHETIASCTTNCLAPIVTVSYWGFTLTDGVLRMLVLLYFHELGYSPLEVALLFILYEMTGVVTNLIGGWIGSRFGLKLTFFSGLGIQILALSMLALLPTSWPQWAAVVYVMASQMFSGVAKDLTKMSSKSAVKLVVLPNAEGGSSNGWPFSLAARML